MEKTVIPDAAPLGEYIPAVQPPQVAQQVDLNTAINMLFNGMNTFHARLNSLEQRLQELINKYENSRNPGPANTLSTSGGTDVPQAS